MAGEVQGLSSEGEAGIRASAGGEKIRAVKAQLLRLSRSSQESFGVSLPSVQKLK